MTQLHFGILCFFIVYALPTCSANAAKGDINDDQKIDLIDTILALQLSAGMSPAARLDPGADVDDDGRSHVGSAAVHYAEPV